MTELELADIQEQLADPDPVRKHKVRALLAEVRRLQRLEHIAFRGVWPDGRTGTEPAEKVEHAISAGFRVLRIQTEPTR